jgi:hypothetical protein
MRLRFLVNWVLGLFEKKKDEIDPREIAAWPFPVPKKKRERPAKKVVTKKPAAKKTATKKPAVKKTVKKKAK